MGISKFTHIRDLAKPQRTRSVQYSRVICDGNLVLRKCLPYVIKEQRAIFQHPDIKNGVYLNAAIQVQDGALRLANAVYKRLNAWRRVDPATGDYVPVIFVLDGMTDKTLNIEDSLIYSGTRRISDDVLVSALEITGPYNPKEDTVSQRKASMTCASDPHTTAKLNVLDRHYEMSCAMRTYESNVSILPPRASIVYQSLKATGEYDKLDSYPLGSSGELDKITSRLINLMRGKQMNMLEDVGLFQHFKWLVAIYLKDMFGSGFQVTQAEGEADFVIATMATESDLVLSADADYYVLCAVQNPWIDALDYKAYKPADVWDRLMGIPEGGDGLSPEMRRGVATRVSSLLGNDYIKGIIGSTHPVSDIQKFFNVTRDFHSSECSGNIKTYTQHRDKVILKDVTFTPDVVDAIIILHQKTATGTRLLPEDYIRKYMRSVVISSNPERFSGYVNYYELGSVIAQESIQAHIYSCISGIVSYINKCLGGSILRIQPEFSTLGDWIQKGVGAHTIAGKTGYWLRKSPQPTFDKEYDGKSMLQVQPADTFFGDYVATAALLLREWHEMSIAICDMSPEVDDDIDYFDIPDGDLGSSLDFLDAF